MLKLSLFKKFRLFFHPSFSERAGSPGTNFIFTAGGSPGESSEMTGIEPRTSEIQVISGNHLTTSPVRIRQSLISTSIPKN